MSGRVEKQEGVEMKPEILSLVICGPSGVGKTYLAMLLIQRYRFRLVLSTMTRSPRDGEVNGVDNEFVTNEEFDAIEESGDFFMVNQFFGHRYGYRRSAVQKILDDGCIPAAIVFTPLVRQYVDKNDCLCVFLKPASLELIEARMRRRGDSAEQIAKRLAGVQTEVEAYEHHQDLFDMVFDVSGDNDVYGIVDTIAQAYRLQ